MWLIISPWIAAELHAEEFQIDGVVIEGSQRIDKAAIVSQLTHTSGKVTTQQISEDVKALYRTGFFDQVTASVVTGSGEGRTVLKYRISEKPVVRRVFIKGNDEIGESELSEILTFDARRFLDRGKVEALVKKGVALYQSRGFYDAAIDYSVLPVGENQVDITFNVTENTRYKIREVRFEGLESLDEDALADVLQTKRYKWWNSWILGTGRLSADMVENDKSLARQYFFDHGLIDGTIGDPEIEKREDGLYLTFTVNEGPVYHIGSIQVSGDLLDDSEEKTLEGIKTAPSEVFNATQAREDAFHISEKFSDIGYAFANVVPNTQIHRDGSTVDLNFAVSKGRVVEINRINIRGNDKTYDHVIRREMRVDEQERYNGSKVRRSQEILQRLGYFEEVNISSEPVGEDKVDLTVNIREGSTGTFSAGAGYSTGDGVLFNTRLSENNLFGTGRRAVLNLDIGDERDSYVLSFEDRRLNDSYVSGGIDVFRTDREFSDFDRELTGSSLTFGYPFEQLFETEVLQDVAAFLKYEYLDIVISDVDREDAADLVIESEGRSRASSLTPRLVRNTINNPLNPTEGSRQEVSVEYAGIGGNQDFYLVEAEQVLYYPLIEAEGGGLTFGWRTNVGYGETFDDEDFPLYRRYFPGGINSVRGYKNRSLGPKDSRGNEYGGSKQFINNFELIFPVIRSAGLKGVTFFDVGEAFDDNESIDFGELRLAYGAGIRWTSPLGPIRVEFGFPIDKEEGEKSMVTQFSFGAPF